MILESIGRAWTESRSGGAASEREPRSFRALLLLIVGGAFLVRALHAYEGLPYLHSWDEPFVVSKALDMMKKGTLDPEYFVYGSLPIYMSLGVSVVHYLWLMGRPETNPPFLNHLDQITTYFDTGWLWEVSHPSFYLWSRWLAAAFGAGTVLLVYLIARRLAGRWAGLLAALFVAGQPFHAMQSSIATVDNPMTFFALLAAWGAIAFVESKRLGHLILSLAACGLAASCKYTAAASLVMPLLALLFVASTLPAPRRRAAWASLPLTPAAAFLAGSPFAILNMRTFLIDLGKAVRVYEATPWAQSAINPGIEHLSLQFSRIIEKLGPVTALVVLAGLILVGSRRPGLVLVAYGAVHSLLIGSSKLSYPRNFLVLYPLLAVAFGAGALLALRAARNVSRYGGPALRYLPALAGLVVVGLPLHAGSAMALAGFEATRHAETRTSAAGRLAELARKAGNARVAIPEEMKVHPQDLARIGASAHEVPFLDLICEEAGYTHAAVPSTWTAYANEQRPWAAILDRLKLGGVVAMEAFGDEAPLSIDSPSLDPAIEILTLDPARSRSETPCLGRFRAADLEVSEPWGMTAGGELAMLRRGWARTGWLLAEPGAHALVWEARGMAAGGEPAKLRVKALGRNDAGETIILEEIVVELPRKLESCTMTFDNPAGGVVSAEIEFINDFYSAEKKSDRNAYVTKIYVLRLDGEGAPGG